ncbi:MAG: hypothetical protein K2K69_04790 [Muribaculaceae bacterium]|nr:hypothetical protein [Muribaculaceae bacterium]
MTYPATEILALRRTLGGLEARNTSLAVERTDGVSIDAILQVQLRRWYLDLLDHADPRLLAPENIASEVSFTAGTDGATILLPERCRRAFSVRLRGWARSVPILPASEFAGVLRRQRNPYTAATPVAPVAVMAQDIGTTPQPAVYAWPADSGIAHLSAVVDRGEHIYILDPSALATMPQSNILIDI